MWVLVVYATAIQNTTHWPIQIQRNNKGVFSSGTGYQPSETVIQRVLITLDDEVFVLFPSTRPRDIASIVGMMTPCTNTDSVVS
jgi:hypothetical protein